MFKTTPLETALISGPDDIVQLMLKSMVRNRAEFRSIMAYLIHGSFLLRCILLYILFLSSIHGYVNDGRSGCESRVHHAFNSYRPGPGELNPCNRGLMRSRLGGGVQARMCSVLRVTDRAKNKLGWTRKPFLYAVSSWHRDGQKHKNREAYCKPQAEENNKETRKRSE